MISNFEFLSIDMDTAELFRTINMAEENYTHGDYEGTLTKVRKVSENTAKLIADREYLEIPERSSFNDVLREIRYLISNKTIVDYFYEIKGKGNSSAHVLNPQDATKENALKSLKQVFDILAWVMLTYINPDIKESAIGQFLEPRAREMYNTAERKFIYIQTVNNENGLFNAFEGTQKIGEGTVSSDDIEADWTPNSEFLRQTAPKRINQYMKTSGLPYTLGWVELAYRKSTKTWFHDYDVHNVLKRSGIKKAEHLEGTEWFKTDLETAKSAIKAVKEGKNYLNVPLEEATVAEQFIELRPEQEAAVKQTQKVFKKKKRMLWNAKMRFGKTLTSLQLVKNEQFQKVLILTHRPVVADSWFEDFRKMKMHESYYEFGSIDKGASIDELKNQNKPFVYFASIQLLRYNNAQTNLKDFANVDWDLIIIDEAHEGTQTELSDTVMKELIKEHTKVLELSGTPFNLLDKFDEEQVYTWDYVMEQTAKKKWELENPDKPNPYETLPKVSMYTFEMKNKNRFSDESKSFNFREFFRVDKEGKLVYKSEVKGFLDNITNPDSSTNYPFSTKAYRKELRHTLWLMPGVKEANAFEELLKEHPIFGKEYKIVNVVRGNSTDDGIANDDDLEKVRSAITDDPSRTKTITLTVRKLTTGVNIPEWTAVIFLSNTNSAMNYLQAAFRAQTPFSHEKLGMKKNCYIFDFAPDRALTVMAESAQINSGVGKINTQTQKQAMARLLNFMPILEYSGNGMKTYDVDRMLTQLKKVYAEKAVRSGFDDDSLYNDKLLSLSSDDVEMFNKIRGIVGSNSKQNISKVVISNNGLTDEEYDRGEKARKKKKKERTEEEKEILEKIKEAKKKQKVLISILRGVSIRIPMMIYGMKVDLTKDISINDFIAQVDEESWREFMPNGFTKGMFSEIIQYYDPEIFIEAGHIIRRRAKSYDKLDFIERAEKIAELFSTFKNPDKETVLTPWRVVNMHLSETLGGLSFYNDTFEHTTSEGKPKLNWIQKELTDKVYSKNTKILDINSKTGLYPLFIASSIYFNYIKQNDDSHFEADKIYSDIIKNNVFAIAKTPMAKTITERTLIGFRDVETNVKYINDFSDIIKHNINSGKEKIDKEFKKLKFDIVIGNPPYQENDNGKRIDGTVSASASPLYHHFFNISKTVSNQIVELIFPARWLTGAGKGLSDFSRDMISDTHIRTLTIYKDSSQVFPNNDIKGGILYLTYDKEYQGKANITVYDIDGEKIEFQDYLDSVGLGIFIPYKELVSIYKKVSKKVNLDFQNVQSITSVRKPFGLSTDFFKNHSKYSSQSIYDNRKTKEDFEIIGLNKLKRVSKFVSSDYPIKSGHDLIDKWKIFVPYAYGSGEFGEIGPSIIVAGPKQVCTETFLVIGPFDTREEAELMKKYFKTKFFRAMIGILKTTQHSTTTYRFIPLELFKKDMTSIDWSKPIEHIDNQLYEKYELTKTEIEFITKKVKEMK
ncbi:Eco57I restriction-modification methylase domain-containing protein [Streptococcus sp. CSL10205-OR2]|uniref:Eco57I restriction-modification methylase domain-containing protein n=1 Tax=Streptococcus sp. CSL10205-OR2 TaxID=2980558 RepID=UPI0021D9BB14|nr:Eco57I restriction-modification methylase domain-containing protein [Streptococcus sp. CSL10205-OR2]MCU9534036.1 Eco57I restriction-modification methylase domain-containing protein [Streptococcus sp. CSL10205-OR2]